MNPHRLATAFAAAVLTAILVPASPAASGTTARIWDRATHCAFTDLARWEGAFYCTFRESDAHVHGADGKIRVIRSADGDTWESVALIGREGIDLRDPKLSTTPRGELMLLMGGSKYEGKNLVGRQPYVAFLAPGAAEFTDARATNIDTRAAGDDGWLWRVTWHGDTGYGIVYQAGDDAWSVHLVETDDGVRYEWLADLDLPGRPNEATIRFDTEGTMLAVIRNEGGDKNGYLGQAAPPFTGWEWAPINARLGGPDLVQLPDGTWLLGTRSYREDGARVVLGPLALDGTFTPRTILPSGGDCSYPGMLVHDGTLWVSYYSSHEDATASIYLHRAPVGDFHQ